MSSKKKQLEKKIYQSPQLVSYGAIREITQAVGNMGNSDNGSQPMHKSYAN